MSHLLSESRISLNEVAKRFDFNVSTVWRWTQKGVRNVKLETISIGAKRYTTEEALERFVEATTLAARGETNSSVVPRTARRIQRDFDEAVKYLESENC